MGHGGFLPSTAKAPSNAYNFDEVQMGGLDLSRLSAEEAAMFERKNEGTFHLTNTFYGYPLHYSLRTETDTNIDYSRERIMEVENGMRKVLAREFNKDSMHDDAYEETDAAGIEWGGDKFSIPQKLQVNFILYEDDSYGSEELSASLGSRGRLETLSGIAQDTGGKLISLSGQQSAEELYKAIDSILNDIIKSSSNAQVIVNQFQKTNNSIRYTSRYNPQSRMGEIIAHKADKATNSAEWLEFNEDGSAVSLWSSESALTPSSGRFVTMAYHGNQPQVSSITMASIRSAYDKGKEGASSLHQNHINWLLGSGDIDSALSLTDAQRVYHKTSPIGPIINSNIELFDRDVEYINLATMDGDVKKNFNQYVLYKNKVLNRDYMIINANDGMVHFIDVPRAEELKKGTKSVTRVAGYFPGILAHRISEISNSNQFSYNLDGAVRLFEFKDSRGNFRSIGLSALGGGGKGLVGYQLFKATPDKTSSSHFKNPDTEIKPLFEISNEGKWSSYGENLHFHNLGYTYSDFGFFNREHPVNTENGQGVAVFGNGYGSDDSGYTAISSLYFIDVENGKQLAEIVLSNDGGGASTPALLVEEFNDYHQLKKIYVGDISGRLYKVTFASSDLKQALVEIVYQPVNNNVYNPISTKPLIVKNGSDEWVYFGTGRKSDELLDRGRNSASKDVQYIVGLKNPQRINNNAVTVQNLSRNTMTTPTNNLTIKVGETVDGPINQIVETLQIKRAEGTEATLEVGWYLPLNQAKILDSTLTTGGERVVFSPKQSYGDVIFSTWGMDEYEMSDVDPCIEDVSYGKVLILDKNTGLLGTGSMANTKIGGFMIKDATPGIHTGNGVIDSLVSGDSPGMSTLDKETIEALNLFEDSTHEIAVEDVCRGWVADDELGVYNYRVGCPIDKKLSGRRLSIWNLQ